MSNSAMDMVIGAGGTKNAEQAVKHLKAAEQMSASGDKPGAIAEYRRALQADSTNVDAMFALAYLLDRIGEEEEAISLYEAHGFRPMPLAHPGRECARSCPLAYALDLA